MGPMSGPAGGANNRQRPGDAGKGPGWGGQICSRGVSKPSQGSYPCLEGMDSVTSKADWVLRAGRPAAGSGGDVHCHSERAGSQASSGRAGDGGHLHWGTVPPEPVGLPEGPHGRWARRASGPAQGSHIGGSGPSPTSRPLEEAGG